MSSFTSTASSIGKGGVRDSFRIHNLSTTISTSPVGMFALIVSGRSLLDVTFGRKHIFAAEHLRFGVNLRLDILVEDQLGDALTVAQVNEDDAAEIAPAMHPSHQ